MQLLSPRSDAYPDVSSGLSLFIPSTGQRKAKSRERRTSFAQPSALSTVAGVGAQVAPQRRPILRTRRNILPRMATLNYSQWRSRDFLNPVQRTFWNPDSRTSYFLVDIVTSEDLTEEQKAVFSDIVNRMRESERLT